MKADTLSKLTDDTRFHFLALQQNSGSGQSTVVEDRTDCDTQALEFDADVGRNLDSNTQDEGESFRLNKNCHTLLETHICMCAKNPA